MKKPETSFIDEFGSSVTFENLNVYKWEIMIERDPVTLKRRNRARLVLHVKYDTIRKDSILQLSSSLPQISEKQEDSDESNSES